MKSFATSFHFSIHPSTSICTHVFYLSSCYHRLGISKLFSVRDTHSICCSYLLLSKHKSSHRQYINDWVWLWSLMTSFPCAIKFFLIFFNHLKTCRKHTCRLWVLQNQAEGQIWPKGRILPTPFIAEPFDSLGKAQSINLGTRSHLLPPTQKHCSSISTSISTVTSFFLHQTTVISIQTCYYFSHLKKQKFLLSLLLPTTAPFSSPFLYNIFPTHYP